MKRKLWVVAIVIIAVVGVGIFSVMHQQKLAPQPKKPVTHTASKTTKQQPTFNKKQYSLTDPASPWVVVNKQHPLNPVNYAPSDLTSVGNSQQMRAEAATELQKMFSDAKTAGYTLVADSGYRSYDTQVSTYGSIVKGYGQTYADTVSARPGFSEHQTGWAVDIGTGACHVQDCFGDTTGGKWTQTNAYKYGFILRYPQSLTNITGYSNEAWHFRYVGTALSTEMHQQNIQTLEQFFNVTGGTTYIAQS